MPKRRSATRQVTPEQFDTVMLTHALPEYDLQEGARGAVVEVYGDHEAYDVEFTDGSRTLALVTLNPDYSRGS